MKCLRLIIRLLNETVLIHGENESGRASQAESFASVFGSHNGTANRRAGRSEWWLLFICSLICQLVKLQKLLSSFH
ncbi:hypothetical protein CEXT_162151 [Caerostris extrusa]|uniref:Uncharacterized protein n=1 Tax=Caerostris extrusa TaxID=172846 RepID=A0AAV4NPE4_CAEEX|nr:hypothetical protein CEXT_162151 [Caerostris extrusa]